MRTRRARRRAGRRAHERCGHERPHVAESLPRGVDRAIGPRARSTRPRGGLERVEDARLDVALVARAPRARATTRRGRRGRAAPSANRSDGSRRISESPRLGSWAHQGARPSTISGSSSSPPRPTTWYRTPRARSAATNAGNWRRARHRIAAVAGAASLPRRRRRDPRHDVDDGRAAPATNSSTTPRASDAVSENTWAVTAGNAGPSAPPGAGAKGGHRDAGALTERFGRGVRGVEDPGRVPPRDREREDADGVGAAEAVDEAGEGLRGCAAEAVDRLVRVAHRHDRVLRAEHEREEIHLPVGGVLELVEQHHPVAGALDGPDLRECVRGAPRARSGPRSPGTIPRACAARTPRGGAPTRPGRGNGRPRPAGPWSGRPRACRPRADGSDERGDPPHSAARSPGVAPWSASWAARRGTALMMVLRDASESRSSGPRLDDRGGHLPERRVGQDDGVRDRRRRGARARRRVPPRTRCRWRRRVRGARRRPEGRPDAAPGAIRDLRRGLAGEGQAEDLVGGEVLPQISRAWSRR